MAMTMTQKILAAHAGLDKVEAGQLILVNVDRVLGNDITSPVAIREFDRIGAKDVFDKEKVTMVMDHFAPNKDIKAAVQCKITSLPETYLFSLPFNTNLIADGTLNQALPVAIPQAISVEPTPVENAPIAP